MAEYWTWTCDTPLPEIEPGTDIEVMFHGGSTARGNLYHCVDPRMVVAFRLHGRVKWSDVNTSWHLVWESSQRIHNIDTSYVRLVESVA